MSIQLVPFGRVVSVAAPGVPTGPSPFAVVAGSSLQLIAKLHVRILGAPRPNPRLCASMLTAVATHPLAATRRNC